MKRVGGNTKGQFQFVVDDYGYTDYGQRNQFIATATVKESKQPARPSTPMAADDPEYSFINEPDGSGAWKVDTKPSYPNPFLATDPLNGNKKKGKVNPVLTRKNNMDNNFITKVASNENMKKIFTKPKHFRGDEEFKGTKTIVNGFKMGKCNFPTKTSIYLDEDSVHNINDEIEEEKSPYNPLFAAAGIYQTQIQLNPKASSSIKNDTKKDSSDSEDLLPSPGSAWRFSGFLDNDIDEIEEVILNDDEEEVEQSSGIIRSPRSTAQKRALELDTPPYMFYNPMSAKGRPNGKSKRSKQIAEMPIEIQSRQDLRKYWVSRYQLFSKYDCGIKLDSESWFSVTPENIAIHVAERCATDGVIIDAFCGCGGNTIQFAKTCARVIAIDIDPIKIANARHNAKIYGVEKKITFVIADFMELAPVLKADVVFLSPPWGGPMYGKEKTFDLETMIPMNGMKVFELAMEISSNIAYYVPRNVDRDQLAELAGLGRTVEIETNTFDGRVKALTAYYGELIQNS